MCTWGIVLFFVNGSEFLVQSGKVDPIQATIVTIFGQYNHNEIHDT